MMNVMLVFPPQGFTSKDVMPHLGLAYLAAVLEKNDIQVEILDAQVEKLSRTDLKKKYLHSKPDIVGITSLTEMRFESFEAAKIAKKSLPESTVIMGGPHASLAAHDTLLNVPSVDIIVRGEGEYTFLETCKTLENKGDLESVKGISYRCDGGEIIHNDHRQLIKNLDILPFPAYHLLSIEKYNFKLNVPHVGKLSALNVITSRGCPIGCAFCATSKMLGKKWRARSPSNVLEELEYLIDTYGI
jgi:anaerobic magnesium-protoporphyrin IX monomethyl ester cyclase